jgi:hypothetical protein
MGQQNFMARTFWRSAISPLRTIGDVYSLIGDTHVTPRHVVQFPFHNIRAITVAPYTQGF